MLEMTATGECVLIWGGSHFREGGGSQVGSQKGGFTGGVHKKGFRFSLFSPLTI